MHIVGASHLHKAENDQLAELRHLVGSALLVAFACSCLESGFGLGVDLIEATRELTHATECLGQVDVRSSVIPANLWSWASEDSVDLLNFVDVEEPLALGARPVFFKATLFLPANSRCDE